MREDWAVEFFENEVRASSGLNHPGIVPVLDHGLVETAGPPPLTPGAPYLVMELIRGASLHSYKGKLSWDRGLLEVGKGGFRLRQGAKVELPADLHEVWRDKVDRVLGLFRGEEAKAIEIAAVLGMRLERDLWHQVCRLSGVRPSPLLVGRLLDERLLRATEDGYVFAHAMFREALVRHARDRRRLHRHNRACAAVFEAAGERSERLGRHLLLAGQTDEALEVLLEAAGAALTEGDAGRAGRLLEYRERALRVLDLPGTDRRWAAGWALQAEQLYMAGRYDESKESLLRLVRVSVQNEWDDMRSVALHLRSRHALREGRVSESQGFLEDALACATDDRMRAKCRRSLGQAHCIQGRAQRGRFMLKQALSGGPHRGRKALHRHRPGQPRLRAAGARAVHRGQAHLHRHPRRDQAGPEPPLGFPPPHRVDGLFGGRARLGRLGPPPPQGHRGHPAYLLRRHRQR
ncbi:MAG TPA: hypothetical protein QGF58_09215 [Myxococcota bacterium]|nr:hypothetical protein [Myxococcota bacterium]